MASKEVEVGNRVILKTGSPEMTVVNFEYSETYDANIIAVCVRYDGDEEIVKKYHQDALEVIE
jgi:uncharacterized protein YodC (DUF2158 family)